MTLPLGQTVDRILRSAGRAVDRQADSVVPVSSPVIRELGRGQIERACHRLARVRVMTWDVENLFPVGD
jgi:hypothetical protein